MTSEPYNRSALSTLETPLSGVEGMSAMEALEAGGLAGWNLRKVPAVAVENGKRIPMPGRYAVLRDNPDKTVSCIGDVGCEFKIVQNEDNIDMLDTLREEAGATFVGVGQLNKGALNFVDMRLPGRLLVGGSDPVDLHLVALNSHDGSSSYTLMALPMRFFCANQLNAAIGGQKGLYRIRHTSGAHDNIKKQAKRALEESFAYLDAFQEEADRLINTRLTTAQFERIVLREFGAEDNSSQARATRADRKVQDLMSLFAEAGTQQGIRETAWAGFNALAEWFDHLSPTRGTDRINARAQKALLDTEFKTHALKLVTAGAK